MCVGVWMCVSVCGFVRGAKFLIYTSITVWLLYRNPRKVYFPTCNRPVICSRVADAIHAGACLGFVCRTDFSSMRP